MVKNKLVALATGAALLAGLSNSNADKLRLTNYGNSGIGTSTYLDLQHQFNGIEGYGDDGAWTNSTPNTIQPEMKAITKPYGTELMNDKRPLDSQTIFHAELSVVNRDNPSAIINTSTNRIKHEIVNGSGGGLDASRLYLSKLVRDAAWNSSGQNITWVTNVINAMGSTNTEQYFMLNLSGITNNLPSGTVYGTLDVSCKFTNQPSQTIGNVGNVTNNLSENQVSGLNYTKGNIVGDTSGLVSILDGTNLVYTPSTNFVGTTAIPVSLSWTNGGGISNYLGTITHNYNVTNVPPANIFPSATNQTSIGNRRDVREGSFLVGDSDGTIASVVLTNAPNTNLVSGVNGSSGFRYFPTGVPGTNTYQFFAVDDKGAQSPIRLFSAVETNTAPTLEDIAMSGSKGIPLTNTLNGVDLDKDTLSYEVAVQGTNGEAIIDGNLLIYTPTSNAPVNDNLRVKGGDGYGGEVINNISINMTNRPPVAYNFTTNVVAEQSTPLMLVGYDPDGDTLNYRIMNGPTNGRLEKISEDIYAYQSANNVYGSPADHFVYAGDDGYSTNTADVAINVSRVDRNPNIKINRDNVLNNNDLDLEVQPNRSYQLQISSTPDFSTYSPFVDFDVAQDSEKQYVPVRISDTNKTNDFGFYRLKMTK